MFLFDWTTTCHLSATVDVLLCLRVCLKDVSVWLNHDMPFVCDSLCSVPIMSHSLTIICYFRFKNGSRIRMHRLFGVLIGMATSATADANQPDQDALKEVGIIASMLAVQNWVMGLQAGRHSCRQRSYIHHISRPKTRLNQAFSEIVLHLLICF